MKINLKKKIDLKAVIITLCAVIILVGLDQLTKYLVTHNEKLLDGEKIIVIKHIISFYLTYNTGAAWSILSGQKILLVSLSIMASIASVMVIIYTASFKKEKILFTISLMLIASGAIGNLIDRAFYSDGVIDFLCFEFIDFPIFNVADSMLSIGAVLLAVYWIFLYKDDKKEEKEQIEETKEVEEDIINEEIKIENDINNQNNEIINEDNLNEPKE